MLKIKECKIIMKICTKCKEVKTIKNFRKDKYSKTGYTCRCKPCMDKKYKNICKYCGKEFFGSHKSQEYCSVVCSNTHKNKINKKYNAEEEIIKNNYAVQVLDGQKVKLNCDNCGKEIIKDYSKYILSKIHYCSKECKYEGNKQYKGEKSATWKGGNVEVSCSWCSEKIKIKRDKFNKFNNFYCSTKCMGKHREIIYKGENSPTWNPNLTDEDRVRSNEEYNNWRNSVYERDNYACQCCGQRGNGTINAHHLDGFNWAKDKRTDIDNGITLCEECHRRFHNAYGYGHNTREQFYNFINLKTKYV